MRFIFHPCLLCVSDEFSSYLLKFDVVSLKISHANSTIWFNFHLAEFCIFSVEFRVFSVDFCFTRWWRWVDGVSRRVGTGILERGKKRCCSNGNYYFLIDCDCDCDECQCGIFSCFAPLLFRTVVDATIRKFTKKSQTQMKPLQIYRIIFLFFFLHLKYYIIILYSCHLE